MIEKIKGGQIVFSNSVINFVFSSTVAEGDILGNQAVKFTLHFEGC